MKLFEFLKPRKLYKLETCYGVALGYCRARNPDHARLKFCKMGLIPNKYPNRLTTKEGNNIMTLIDLAKYEKLMPFAKALAEGKNVEYNTSSGWYKLYGHVGLDSTPLLELRIAPEPKFRPWTPEECVGKKIRYKRAPFRVAIITSATAGTINSDLNADGNNQWYLENCEQLDGSPCGIVITE